MTSSQKFAFILYRCFSIRSEYILCRIFRKVGNSVGMWNTLESKIISNFNAFGFCIATEKIVKKI